MIYRNAELVLKDGVKRADLLVENGVIKKIAPRLDGEGIDLTGLTVFAGLVDMHVHLRETGYEKKEDIGCRKGGLYGNLLYAQHQARVRQ